MMSTYGLPFDIDQSRIYTHLNSQYNEEINEVKDCYLTKFIKWAELYDEKRGDDKDKPKKWFLIGSYFYYKVNRFLTFDDKLHFILGTYCFLKSIRCLDDKEDKSYNKDLGTIAAGRLINFWILFPEDLRRELFIKVGKVRRPNSTSEEETIYNNTFVRIHNCLVYRFFSRYNGISNVYRDYITKYEFDYINSWSSGIHLLFDYNYEARTEIIENDQKYLDTLWEIVSSDEIVKNIKCN